MCSVISILNIFVLLNIHNSFQSPINQLVEEKAAFKISGEIQEDSKPITLEQIKMQLKFSDIFDERQARLSESEYKELEKLYDTIEIMTTSRNRQPNNVQVNMFSALRMMERVIKKQLKENQLSESLASKFKWQNLSYRPRRSENMYHLDKTSNMRVFNLDS